MKCVICQYGETEPGTTTVALTRDDTTIVIRDVPALICTICGEEYVDTATGRRLSEIAEKRCMKGFRWTYGAIKPHRAFDSNWLTVLMSRCMLPTEDQREQRMCKPHFRMSYQSHYSLP